MSLSFYLDDGLCFALFDDISHLVKLKQQNIRR